MIDPDTDDRLERLAERVDELERELDRRPTLREHAELERECSQLRDEVDEISAWREFFRDKALSNLLNSVAELQGREMFRNGTLEHVVPAYRAEVDAYEIAEMDVIEYPDVSPSVLLPIQEMDRSRRAGYNGLRKPEKRATIIWQEFIEHGDPSGGTRTLTSASAGEALDGRGESDHSQAIKRAMEILAKNSEGLIDHEVVGGTRRLVADEDDLQARLDEITEAAREDRREGGG